MCESMNIKIPDTTIGLGMIKDIGNAALKLHASKILIITDNGIIQAGIIDTIKNYLIETDISFDLFDRCKPEPSITMIEEIANIIKDGTYDLLIGVGGGSNMDATKVASFLAYADMSLSEILQNPQGKEIEGKVIPKILVPTTAGTGAEWSIAAVVYDKFGLGHPFANEKNSPDKVIIDPELCVTLPAKITAETGFDALTHAIEAYTCSTANYFSDMFASSAIKLIAENLRQAYAKGSNNIKTRYNMSLAAAMAMNSAIVGGMGMCHLISEYVQTKAHISHGASLAIMLPTVMDYNLIGNPQKFVKIAELMGENIHGLCVLDAGAKSITAVNKLIHDLRLPRRISETGILESDIEMMAKEAYKTSLPGVQRWNPREVSESDILQIFKAAF